MSASLSNVKNSYKDPFKIIKSLQKAMIYLLLCVSIHPLIYTHADENMLDNFDELALEGIKGNKTRVFLIAKRETVVSADISEKIISIPFVMGESFNKGDLLIELDSELTSAAKMRAEKELQAATINLEAINDLSSRGDATHVELINAERDKVIAETGLILANKNLSSCKILAPYSGRVIKVEKNEFEHIKTGEPLLKIIDDNTLLAHFLLPIKDFPITRTGTKIVFTIPLLDREFSGTISQISATLDAASSTFEVAADVDNSEGLLRAGMSGWLDSNKFKESCLKSTTPTSDN